MTTVSDAFPSNYLKAADLNNRTVKVAIDKVTFEEIGQEKDKKPVMYFADVKKGLVLNKTNAIRRNRIGRDADIEKDVTEIPWLGPRGSRTGHFINLCLGNKGSTPEFIPIVRLVSL